MRKLIYLVNDECRVETQILTNTHIPSLGTIPRHTTLTPQAHIHTRETHACILTPEDYTRNDFPYTHKPNLAPVSYC